MATIDPANPEIITLDESAITLAFQTAMVEAGPPINIFPLIGGYGHKAWKVYTQENLFLLKLCVRHPQIEDLANEVKAHALAQSHGVYTPKIVALGTNKSILGGYYYVQQWVDGEMAELTVPKMSEAERIGFGSDFGLAIARLHRIIGSGFANNLSGGDAFSSHWVRFFKARIEEVTSLINIIDKPTVAAIRQRCIEIAESLNETINPAFTHHDLDLTNVLTNNNLFKAIIDFEQARYFDPLWDFVTLECWVFDAFPNLYDPFMKTYYRNKNRSIEDDRRIFLYQGIEYLAMLHYFGYKDPDPFVVRFFQHRLQLWLSAKTGNWLLFTIKD